jgi:hypothetical protein
MISLALIIPGAIVAYALFVRPILRAMPQLKAFYARADGFWGTMWALCGNSLTIAWMYIVQLVGQVFQWIDPIASMMGDPDFRAQITEALGANPKALGHVLMVISAVTIAARLRSFATKGGD